MIKYPTCLKDLPWDIAGVEQTEQLQEKLRQLGWNESTLRGLCTYVSPNEDQILVVLRTGRVQLRISYIVAPDKRARHAQAIFQQLFTDSSSTEA